MRLESPRPAGLQPMRCRLFIRQRWSFVAVINPRTKAIDTTTDPNAAMTWLEPDAIRIGTELSRRHAVTVDLRPLPPTSSGKSRPVEREGLPLAQTPIAYAPDTMSHRARLLKIDIAQLNFLLEGGADPGGSIAEAASAAVRQQAAAIIGAGCR